MKYFVATLMLICGLPPICAAAELTGTVRSKSGQPLSGVVVMSRCRGVAETDVAGSFNLRPPSSADCGKVVFFWAAGFLPQIKIVDESTKEIHAVLEESPSHGRIILACSETRTNGRRLGWLLRVPVPRGASVERSRGLHGAGWNIKVRSKKRRIKLNGYGGQYAHSYPSDDLILTATELTIQTWRSGKEEGVDLRGRASDGTRWRYFAVFGEEVQYSGVSDEEANMLDNIIDGACVEPPAKAQTPPDNGRQRTGQ